MVASIRATIDPAALARTRERMTSPALWGPPVERLIDEGADLVLREAQTNARDLGGIPSSLTREGTGLAARVVSDHPGALVREFGRRAGKRLPPIDTLARYGGVAFLIARAIAKRGFEGRFYLRRAREHLNREMPAMIDRTERAIAARWRAP